VWGMALLPAGFALPPLPYLLGLVVAVVAVGVVLRRRRPPVTERTVLALAPWIVAGSAVHVLFVVGALPGPLRPLAGTPAVYVSIAVLAGATWAVADLAVPERTPAVLAAVGTAALLPSVAAALLVGAGRGTLAVGWPAVALVVALAVGAATWLVLGRVRPDAAATGAVGALVVVAHAVDAVSTAVGVDVLGFGERTPLSRLVIEFAAGLPTADLVGAGWLFVAVKLLVACGVVVLFTDYVRHEPGEGYLLLGLVAAVGLGPGVHNLLLFSIASV